MKSQVGDTVKCEMCERRGAEFFSCDPPRGNVSWRLVCTDCAGTFSSYDILISDFFRSPAETIDFMAHLSEKNWMDWGEFAGMIRRLRNVNWGLK